MKKTLIKSVCIFSVILFALFTGCTNPGSSSATAGYSTRYADFESYAGSIIAGLPEDESDLSVSDAGIFAVKIKTAAEIYNIKTDDVLSFLNKAGVPQILMDLIDGSAGIDGSAYYNSNEGIALEIIPENVDQETSGVETSDGVLSFDSGDKLELPSNDLLNLSDGGTIEFTFKNTNTDQDGNIVRIDNAFLFRKGSTWERLPYSFEIDGNNNPVIAWVDGREDEAISFQIFRNNLLFSLHLIDKNGREHIITVKAKSVSDAINTGKALKVKVVWNKEVRIFLQEIDGNGDPVFDGNGEPVMANVTTALGISNLKTKINGTWTDILSDFNDDGTISTDEKYTDYLNNECGGLAELVDTDPDDIHVKIADGVSFTTTDASVLLGGGFSLENMTVNRNDAVFDLFGEISNFIISEN